jgi:dTDP-4-dehydrorhamnose reductase
MSLCQSTLITGAGGMLGHALAYLLRSRGVTPITCDRASLDIANPDALAEVFADHKPTLLLNCAAHTKVDLCEQEQDKANAINGTAVGQMAELSRRNGTCLVHVSTDFVFNGSGSRPYRSDEPVQPLSAYGRSKLLGETLLQENAPKDWLIVRTAWVYGRHGANFPRTMVTAARAGKPLKVVNDQVGSPTYTVDLAEGILALLDHGARGLWHLTNAGQTNWRDFAQAAVEEFGIKTEVAPCTSAEWQKIRPNSAHRPSYSVLDIEPFAKLVGRPMRNWRDALRDYRKAVDAAGEF